MRIRSHGYGIKGHILQMQSVSETAQKRLKEHNEA